MPHIISSAVAHMLDDVMTYLAPILFVIAFGCWFAAIVTAMRIKILKKGNKWMPFYMSFFGLGGCVGIIFAVASYIKAASLQEISPFLQGDILAVQVNNRPISPFDHLLAALRTIQNTPAHHSRPTSRYIVAVRQASGDISLDLQRDSANPHEYWVFYQSYKATRNNDIGHVFTDALDAVAPE